MRLVRVAPCGQAVALGLGLLAASHLAAAGWMLLAPDSFVHSIGPIGGPDGHSIGIATVLVAAQGAGLAVALVRPAWRTGVLATSIAVLSLLTADRWIEITTGRVAAGAGSLDAGLLTLGLALTLTVALTARFCPCNPMPRGGAHVQPD
jgi:hypothetical protein